MSDKALIQGVRVSYIKRSSKGVYDLVCANVVVNEDLVSPFIDDGRHISHGVLPTCKFGTSVYGQAILQQMLKERCAWLH